MTTEHSHDRAMQTLRRGRNPFSTFVATDATAALEQQASVRELIAGPLSDLHAAVDETRKGNASSRLYLVLGDNGTGKTHLAHLFLAELASFGRVEGRDSLAVILGDIPEETEPADFLVWQLTGRLLERSGEGARIREVAATKLTGTLLGEGLRQLSPHQRLALIPSEGLWEKLRYRFGSSSVAGRRLGAVANVIARCDGSATAADLRTALDQSRMPVTTALEVIESQIERNEPKNALGWFRRGLFNGLARLCLTDDMAPLEEFHQGDYSAAPGCIRDAASNLGRVLLRAWLELFRQVGVQVVVLFDQIEPMLSDADPKRQLAKQKRFTQHLADFIDRIPHLCVMGFAEEGYWNSLLQTSERYIVARLSQPIELPGRPTKQYIVLDGKQHSARLSEIIRRRVVALHPDIDLTGLPPYFPFSKSDLSTLANEVTVRNCLRRLADRYDQIVFPRPNRVPPASGLHPPPPTVPPLGLTALRLQTRWEFHVEAVKRQHGSRLEFSTTSIPAFQTAITTWLECLLTEFSDLSGKWHQVELLNDTAKNQYGYLTLIRANGLNQPGLGVAVWLGEKAWKSHDLITRLAFFQSNPCPISTLVLLRADYDGTLTASSEAEHNKAVKAGRDVRIQTYTAKQLHGFLAFKSWYQEIQSEVVTEEDRQVFHDFLADISKDLLAWVTKWTAAPLPRETP